MIVTPGEDPGSLLAHLHFDQLSPDEFELQRQTAL
jgi:hypothetical protein